MRLKYFSAIHAIVSSHPLRVLTPQFQQLHLIDLKPSKKRKAVLRSAYDGSSVARKSSGEK
jgi:hypothetical protein